jgi:hypothetical protein
MRSQSRPNEHAKLPQKQARVNVGASHYCVPTGFATALEEPSFLPLFFS